MIRFEGVTVTYPDDTSPEAVSPHGERPALSDVSLDVPEGELALVVGPTGSGKSTLLRAVNGLVPWFTGGELAGRVTVAGRSTAEHPPRELADVVGMVAQAPADDFVTDVVEDELAYTMENLGVPPDAMRRRVEEVIDLLGLQEVRRRPLVSLSSGQQQRVAIGSVLAATPRALLLDEPTSALDPVAAEEVLAVVTRLVHDLGLTVLMAEHRLERVVQYADRVVLVEDGVVVDGSPPELMVEAPIAPPVVELGRLAGWSPLPLSVRDARRAAAGLRDELAGDSPPPVPDHDGAGNGHDRTRNGDRRLAEVRSAVVRYGSVHALAGVDLDVNRSEIVAVMGRNGAGKSTLLGRLAGLREPDGGRVLVAGEQPHRVPPSTLVERVALVPSDPGLLLYAGSVAEECELADREGGLEPGTTAAAVEALLGDVDGQRHPRDLSEGQRLALALGIVLAPEPALVLLDEPTRGLDYPAKRQLTATLRDLAALGRGVVLATHDVELVAELATRVVVMAEGEIVADGPARDVVVSSPMFSPQVAKILSPAPFLTVREVEEALAS